MADRGAVARFARDLRTKLERAVQRATDRAATNARDQIRAEMKGAGLGRLSNVVAAGSDLKKRRIHRDSDGFSASGFLYVRGARNERTAGALEAYTQGADIRPKRGRMLWIATPSIPRRMGRYRMTPERYVKGGLEERIGPLVEIPGRRAGERLLIVENVSVRRDTGGSARALPRRKLNRGRQERLFIVAFVGIRITRRSRRSNPSAIIAKNVARLGDLVADELRSAR